MELSKHLLLFRYVLRQFGYDSFGHLHDELAARQPGYDATGRSYLVSALLGAAGKTVDDHTLRAYDEAIRGYEDRLRTHRAGEFGSFKYYQYVALLFTEYFLDQLRHGPTALLAGLNAHRATDDDFARLSDYTPADLKKLAYWMATGSGKTPLMHVNYWQIQRYFPDWENILLITPNEGLSQQHLDEFRQSGIPAKRYAGSEESLKTRDGEVLILEITKLVRDKGGEGVSVDVDYFSESRNLVFIDEGHKGQRSEEKAWKRLREHLTRGEGSFTFEYSATFGQIIGRADTDLLNEYGKAILVDYSYRHFYADGYGKDFAVFNIDAKTEYSEEQTRLLLVGSLLGFYEQLCLYELHTDELRAYRVECPLWVFVGSKVQGDVNQSDITRVLRFFADVLAHPARLQADLDRILEGRANLQTPEGDGIFAGRFEHLRAHRPAATEVLTAVFHGVGQLDAHPLRQAEGEIGLRTRTGEQFFGVVNIGDVPKFTGKLRDDPDGTVAVQDDHFTKSLFQEITGASSPIHVLIGSKKFIEGWNSWRVASMGLMNMGKSEGAQIIQLFGRGVRLKGRDYSLQREGEGAPYHLRALQTIRLFGLNASYMNTFLSAIEKETPDHREAVIPLRLNRPERWENTVLTFRTDAARPFADVPVTLDLREDILKRITIDLRGKVSVAAGGFNNALAEETGGYHPNFLHEYRAFLDGAQLWQEALRYKRLRGYHNLVIHPPVLEQIVRSGYYKLLSAAGQFGLPEALSGRMQDVAGYVVKDYLNKFYADREKDFLTQNLTFDYLNRTHDVFPEGRQMVVKVPRHRSADLDALLADLENLYEQDDNTLLPTLHVADHLYSPVADWRKGTKFQEIKTVPVKLNEGETKFLDDLRTYLTSVADRLVGKEIYVLRNLSKRGVGFFIEARRFTRISSSGWSRASGSTCFSSTPRASATWAISPTTKSCSAPRSFRTSMPQCNGKSPTKKRTSP